MLSRIIKAPSPVLRRYPGGSKWLSRRRRAFDFGTASEIISEGMDQYEFEPDLPKHMSNESLGALRKMIAAYQEPHGARREHCINCMAPRSQGQMQCPLCSHAAKNDAELLGMTSAAAFNWIAAAATATSGSASGVGAPYAADQPTVPADGPASSGRSDPSIPLAVKASGAQSSAEARNPLAPVVLAVDERMLLHRTSLPPHPERPERLQAIMARLASSSLTERCSMMACREATDAELLAVHSPAMVAALPSSSDPAPSGDAALLEVLEQSMLVGPHTAPAARVAAGTAIDVARAVASGSASSGVAVIRPPGHHAGKKSFRGGCFFNNVAAAARAVQADGGDGEPKRRIMIVDWDVHFGQGTQEIFDKDESVMYLSLHRDESEMYPSDVPCTVEVVGRGAGEGFTVNLAWEGGERGGRGATDGDYVSAFMHVVVPLAFGFAPDVILVSAGFGAADRNLPGGSCNLSPSCYAHMTHLLKGVAPVALMLEGGFNLDETASCMEACVRVLLGERPPPLVGGLKTTPAGWVAIMNAMQVHGSAWPDLRPLSWNGWMDAIKQAQAEAVQQEDVPGDLEVS